MRYVVLGASGAVGREVVPILAGRDVTVRVVGRSESRLRDEFGRFSDIEVCAADISEPAGARRALDGADVVFYLVGVPYTDFALHPRLMDVALDAAAEAGVKRFLHVSTVYPYGLPRAEMVDESHARDPNSVKGRMRKEQEDLVFAADGRNGMRTTMVRPPDFYGPTAELSYARSMFEAAVNGGRADVIGPIDAPHEFIFVPDLARTIVALAEKDEAYGKAWNVGSAGVITTRRFAEMVFAEVGREPKLRVAGKGMLTVMGLFSSFMREVKEMHYLWTSPVILDDSRLQGLLPELRKTPYDEGIRETIQAMRGAKAKTASA